MIFRYQADIVPIGKRAHPLVTILFIPADPLRADGGGGVSEGQRQRYPIPALGHIPRTLDQLLHMGNGGLILGFQINVEDRQLFPQPSGGLGCKLQHNGAVLSPGNGKINMVKMPENGFIPFHGSLIYIFI